MTVTAILRRRLSQLLHLKGDCLRCVFLDELTTAVMDLVYGFITDLVSATHILQGLPYEIIRQKNEKSGWCSLRLTRVLPIIGVESTRGEAGGTMEVLVSIVESQCTLS